MRGARACCVGYPPPHVPLAGEATAWGVLCVDSGQGFEGMTAAGQEVEA